MEAMGQGIGQPRIGSYGAGGFGYAASGRRVRSHERPDPFDARAAVEHIASIDLVEEGVYAF